jgi:hypothetical protein
MCRIILEEPVLWRENGDSRYPIRDSIQAYTEYK